MLDFTLVRYLMNEDQTERGKPCIVRPSFYSFPQYSMNSVPDTVLGTRTTVQHILRENEMPSIVLALVVAVMSVNKEWLRTE